MRAAVWRTACGRNQHWQRALPSAPASPRSFFSGYSARIRWWQSAQSGNLLRLVRGMADASCPPGSPSLHDGTAASAVCSIVEPPAPPLQDTRPKVIVVLGPTGSGKSQLAIDLAQHFGVGGGIQGIDEGTHFNGSSDARIRGADIINCDVIQMYRGLDIASAKVPLHERDGVPHHMMSFLGPTEGFTVRDFRSMSGYIIDECTGRGTLPIVVGGTMYYVQSLLRDSLMDESQASAVPDSSADRPDGGVTAGTVSSERTIAAPAGANVGDSTSASSGAHAATATTALAPTAPLDEPTHDVTSHSGEQVTAAYRRLQVVDPVMARRLHPHDDRKIERALQVYEATRVPYSEMVRRQATSRAVEVSPYNVLVFWLRVEDQDVHDARLDKRVRTMMYSGLLGEIRQLREALRHGRGGNAALSGVSGSERTHSGAGGGATHADADAVSEGVAGADPSRLTLQALEQLRLSGKQSTKGVHKAFPDRTASSAVHAAVEAVPSVESKKPDSADAPHPECSELSTDGLTGDAECSTATRTSCALITAGSTAGDTTQDSFETGILQAIGYKEFAEYLSASEACGLSSEELAGFEAAFVHEFVLGSGADAAHSSAGKPPKAKRQKRDSSAADAASGDALNEAAGAVTGEPTHAIKFLGTEAAVAASGTDSHGATGAGGEGTLSHTPALAAMEHHDHDEAPTIPETTTIADDHSACEQAAARVGHTAQLQTLLQRSTQRLMDVTHRYARVQNRFVRNRFEKRGMQLHVIDTSEVGGGTASASGPAALSAASAAVPISLPSEPLGSGVEPAEVSPWEARVLAPALAITRAWLAGAALNSDARAWENVPSTDSGVGTAVEDMAAATGPLAADADRIFTWQKFPCEVCNRVLNGQMEWDKHLISKCHQRTLAARARHARLQAQGITVTEKRHRNSSTAGGSGRLA